MCININADSLGDFAGEVLQSVNIMNLSDAQSFQQNGLLSNIYQQQPGNFAQSFYLVQNFIQRNSFPNTAQQICPYGKVHQCRRWQTGEDALFCFYLRDYVAAAQQGTHFAIGIENRAAAGTAGNRLFQQHTDITFAGAVASHLHIFRFEIIRHIVGNAIILLEPMADIFPAGAADYESFILIPLTTGK